MSVLENIEKNKNGCQYGIPYLDDTLYRIPKGELVLIGARTGAGKSTIALNIAKHNASLGKRVVLYSLEDFKGDIHNSETYYAFVKLTGLKSINKSDFVRGRFDYERYKKEINEADAIATKNLKGIEIVNRTEKFTKDDLEKSVKEKLRMQDIDLIIIDHIDYMDKENENISDLNHISDLMREIRRFQAIYEIPVICMSHLRKPGTQKEKVIIPSIDEFIGSSNKVKESTVVILIAPDDIKNAEFPFREIRYTWCVIRKDRIGSINNTAAKMLYNKTTGKYEPKYTKWRVNYGGTEVTEIGEN